MRDASSRRRSYRYSRRIQIAVGRLFLRRGFWRAASSYRKTITLGGKPYGVETVTQTIGAHETRTLFGCDVEIVHVHRESDTKTQNQSVSGYRAVVDEDYALSLASTSIS
jgi:hypothetical protein